MIQLMIYKREIEELLLIRNEMFILDINCINGVSQLIWQVKNN